MQFDIVREADILSVFASIPFHLSVFLTVSFLPALLFLFQIITYIFVGFVVLVIFLDGFLCFCVKFPEFLFFLLSSSAKYSNCMMWFFLEKHIEKGAREGNGHGRKLGFYNNGRGNCVLFKHRFLGRTNYMRAT